MSIFVQPNPDGSYTVTCGGESITIGGHPKRGPFTSPGDVIAPTFTPFTPFTISAQTVVVAKGPEQFHSITDIQTAIQDRGQTPFVALPSTRAVRVSDLRLSLGVAKSEQSELGFYFPRNDG